MVGKRNGSQGVWWQVARVARTQLGVISRQQLRELGFSDSSIDDAAARGHLHPVFRSVFGVGYGPLGIHARLLAATIACGEGSVVSHGTAAWLLRLRDRRPYDVDVIAPVESGRKIGGVRRRFVPPPSPSEIEVRAGVPTTNPSRTLVDNAGSLRGREMEALIEEAAVLGVLDLPAIDSILDGPARRGARRLLRLLEPWRRYEEGIVIRSRLEAKLLPLLTGYGLPVPETNAGVRLEGKRYEIDFLWRSQRVAVEADSRRHHDNPAAGARDSQRNRVLIRSGYAVLRLGWEDLRDRPAAAMAELRTLLS
jgi:hypothetical protein